MTAQPLVRSKPQARFALAALMVALALALGVVFLDRAGQSVHVQGNEYCPRNVLGEMFNLNEHVFLEGEPRSKAEIDADKAKCRSAAAPAMIVGGGSLAGALAFLLGAASIVARPSRRARRTVLAVLGVALVLSFIVVSAS
ncbi:hypothetical protein [Actinopolymorpha alba]|uniref:hypothetical protein n=1 Tax=Actinopolymorpha alba TaxID=533267 RepID=UPI00036DAF2E|nr:hypothetical protein [Actinopolymorpha alba]